MCRRQFARLVLAENDTSVCKTCNRLFTQHNFASSSLASLAPKVAARDKKLHKQKIQIFRARRPAQN